MIRLNDLKNFVEISSFASFNVAEKKLEVTQPASFSTLVLGCHSIVGSYFIPKLLRLAEKKIPGYKIKLEHDLSRNIQSSIQRGKIDIGVIVYPIRHPDLIVKGITFDKFCIWKSRKIKPQEQVIADPEIFQVQSILKKWKNAPRKSISTNSLDLVAKITNEGGGYGTRLTRAKGHAAERLDLNEAHTEVS